MAFKLLTIANFLTLGKQQAMDSTVKFSSSLAQNNIFESKRKGAKCKVLVNGIREYYAAFLHLSNAGYVQVYPIFAGPIREAR